MLYFFSQQMIDLIEAIYALPITAYYDEAKTQTLDKNNFNRFHQLIIDFMKDMRELTVEQQSEHGYLVEMIEYIYKCYRLILAAT